MHQLSDPRIIEVALVDSPRGVDLLARAVSLLRGKRSQPGGSDVAIGGRCPYCTQAVVIAVVGGWTAEEVSAALQAAGRCRHDAPASPG